MSGHVHHEWLAKVAADISEDYERLHAAARDASRVQQSGHGAEATWIRFLTDWLPPQYGVERRRYIVPEEGAETFETDIVVFRPSYPEALRRREEVLAAGVAAAFSVKLTLDAAGLSEAVEQAAKLSGTVQPRLGTPRSEVLPPFPFGVLAHSHGWKRPACRQRGRNPVDPGADARESPARAADLRVHLGPGYLASGVHPVHASWARLGRALLMGCGAT